MSFSKYIMNFKNALLCGAMALVVFSCKDDDFGYGEMTPDDRIAIGAYVSGTTNTRANMPYIDEGIVDRPGSLLLHYRKAGASYSSSPAYVEFGNPEGPATGFAYYLENNTRKDLKWRHIYGEGSSAQTFYLSNMDPATYYNYTSYYHFTFNQTAGGKSNNPYVAGPLDEVNGTNDLLNGSVSGRLSTGKLEFDLKHVLSLLKVNIEVYGAKSDNHVIKLENAKVSISNLCTELYNFRRTYPERFDYNATTTGNVTSSSSYGMYRKPATVILRDGDDDTRLWAEIKKDQPVEGYEGQYTKNVYSTNRFVYPPQSIPPTDVSGNIPATSSGYTGTPVLSVTIPKADVTGNPDDTGEITYSGYIPMIMYEFDDEGNLLTETGQTISLKSGYQLTITAQINSPDTQLSFAPVKLEAWVSKSNWTLNVMQAGIFNAEQFDAFVKDYNAAAADPSQAYKLEKYGYITTGDDGSKTYVIQFWNSFRLNKAKIKDCLKQSSASQNPPFSFLFNGYTLTLDDGTAEGEELKGAPGQASLYTLVTGKSKTYGIQTAADMRAFMTAVDHQMLPNLIDIDKYALMDSYDNTCKVDITGSFEINLSDIFMKMYSQFHGYEVEMRIAEGQTVTVNIGGGYKIQCKSTDEYNMLQKLCSVQLQGIQSAQDFYFMIDCYNKYNAVYPDILNLYGTKNETTGTWSFLISKSFTVDGNRAFLCMVPDPNNNKPDYNFTASTTITYEHDLIPCSGSTGSGHKYIWAGSGYNSTSNNGISTIINYYNDQSKLQKNYFSFWQYGKFENGKWIFKLKPGTYSYHYCSYSTIFGQMIPDIEAGKYDFEFDLSDITYFDVRYWNGGSSSDRRYFNQNGDYGNYTYPRSAADLKKVALGTYTD